MNIVNNRLIKKACCQLKICTKNPFAGAKGFQENKDRGFSGSEIMSQVNILEQADLFGLPSQLFPGAFT